MSLGKEKILGIGKGFLQIFKRLLVVEDPNLSHQWTGG